MKHHLNDWEISAAAAGLDLDEEQRRHLGRCLLCRSAVNEFRDATSLRKLESSAGEPDWELQRAAVLRRLTEHPTTHGRVTRFPFRPLLAAAAMVAVALGAGLFSIRSGPAPTPTPLPTFAVEEVLAEAETLLADDGLVDLELFDNLSDDDLDALFADQAS